MSGVSTEAICILHPAGAVWDILWTESSRADYIHFIIKKDLMLQLYAGGHSVTRQAPMCVCYIGPVFSLEVSSIGQPCPAPQHLSTRLLVMFDYADSLTACALCHQIVTVRSSQRV